MTKKLLIHTDCLYQVKTQLPVLTPTLFKSDLPNSVFTE